ncbi:winged helix-turn-helix domain-containing protein [Burkholderia sp. PU8-34]
MPGGRSRFDSGSIAALTRVVGPCALTRGEFELLAAIVRQPSRVWSSDQLLEHTRGFGIDVYDRTTACSACATPCDRPAH